MNSAPQTPFDHIAAILEAVDKVWQRKDFITELARAHEAFDNLHSRNAQLKSTCQQVFDSPEAERASTFIALQKGRAERTLAARPWEIAPLQSKTRMQKFIGWSGIYDYVPKLAPIVHKKAFESLPAVMEQYKSWMADSLTVKHALTPKVRHAIGKSVMDSGLPGMMQGRVAIAIDREWNEGKKDFETQGFGGILPENIDNISPHGVVVAFRAARHEVLKRVNGHIDALLQQPLPECVEAGYLQKICDMADKIGLLGVSKQLKAYTTTINMCDETKAGDLANAGAAPIPARTNARPDR